MAIRLPSRRSFITSRAVECFVLNNDRTFFCIECCLLLKDAGKAFLLGLAVAAGVFILLLAVGAVSHGFSALAGLELARRGLFIVGALALLVSAGALLLPEKAASVREKDGWTARFGRFGLFGVLFCAAAAILLVAGVLDGWMYSAFV